MPGDVLPSISSVPGLTTILPINLKNFDVTLGSLTEVDYNGV